MLRFCLKYHGKYNAEQKVVMITVPDGTRLHTEIII